MGSAGVRGIVATRGADGRVTVDGFPEHILVDNVVDPNFWEEVGAQFFRWLNKKRDRFRLLADNGSAVYRVVVVDRMAGWLECERVGEANYVVEETG
ncbi:MAG: hypothetical protein ACRDGM_18165 [bacterium]